MDTTLHIHNDLDYMFKNTNIPLIFNNKQSECYIMQRDKIVFIGTIKAAKMFVVENENKELNVIWYEKG